MAESQKSVCLLISEDVLQIEKKISQISRQHFGAETVERLVFDAAVKSLNFNEDPILGAVQELISPSLIYPCRIVVLQHIDRLSKRGMSQASEEETEALAEPSKKNSKNRLEPLLHYLKNPSSEVPLILTAETEKEISSPLLKALENADIQHLPKTSLSQIRAAVIKKCSDRNVAFAPDALDYFMECCGEAATAQRELEKILNWAEEKTTITLEDCRRLVQSSQEEDIWALSRAVEGKNAEAALQSFNLLLEQGDEPIAIIGRLTAMFRSLLLCKALADEKVPRKEWEKRVGKRGYGLEQTVKVSQGFSANSLRRAVSLLRQADEAVKGGKSDPHRVAERLILELCWIGKPGSHG